jgi:hypothetical protein
MSRAFALLALTPAMTGLNNLPRDLHLALAKQPGLLRNRAELAPLLEFLMNDPVEPDRPRFPDGVEAIRQRRYGAGTMMALEAPQRATDGSARSDSMLIW